MSYKATDTLLNNMLNAAKTALDGGFFYCFAGAVPTNAADALNVATTHTQLFRLTVGGDGTTGLTFETAAAAVLAKETTEVWSGLVAFDGFADASATLTPTFFRFCPAGDDGRGAGSGVRLQGTVGGPASSADVKLGTDTVTDNGSNTQALDGFVVNLSSLA